MSVFSLIAACHSAACAPPLAGGTGGSLPEGADGGDGGPSIRTAPKPSETSAKALRNTLLRDGFDVASVKKLTSRSWEITTGDGKKIKVAAGGSLERIPRDESKATMRKATDEDKARLRIPKNWDPERVMVSKDPNGDGGCLARGFDTKTGEPRSLYSAEHTAGQAAAKYDRVKRLEEHLDKIDDHVVRNAATDDTAAALLVLRRTGLRPGSESDRHDRPASFGITSLETRHVKVLPDGNLRLVFVGKAGVRQSHLIKDPDMVAAIKSRLDGKGPNDKLFNTDEKRVNAMLDDITGSEFNVKDLRTHKATVVALETIARMRPPRTQAEFKKARTAVGEAVSKVLGNDPPTALKSYINPALFDEWSTNVQSRA